MQEFAEASPQESVLPGREPHNKLLADVARPKVARRTDGC